jgi:hypothetical protein
MNIRYLHRTAIIPKEPTFQIEGDSYRSQFVGRSARLTEALAKDESLQAFSLDIIDGKEKPIPLQVETTPNASGSTLNKIAISLLSTSTHKQPKPTCIRLRCGDWADSSTAMAFISNLQANLSPLSRSHREAIGSYGPTEKCLAPREAAHVTLVFSGTD